MIKEVCSAVLALLICTGAGAFSPVWQGRRSSFAYRASPEDQKPSESSSSDDDSSLTVVVVGGGWAGFSAADAISSLGGDNVQVQLLDASPRGPGGLAGGWRTARLNRSVEAGIHGFWREYRNTFAAMGRIGLDLDDALTPFTPSTLVSSSGKVALAPVLGEGDDQFTDAALSSLLSTLVSNPTNFTAELAALLPPPLDVALLTEFDENSSLSGVDRLSGLGMLGAWADFGQEDRVSWLRYDQISAENLFRYVAALSPNLYRELVSPLLHVLPMAPGYDCSAAAALSCFHVFALQSRGAFDVRWCRGSITEKIFNPWVQHLQEKGNVQVRGACKVTSVEECSVPVEGASKHKPFAVTVNDSKDDAIECDAVVFAVGATTAGRLVDACPPLQAMPDVADKWKQLRGVTCVAVRLFVDPAVARQISQQFMADSPVVVCGPEIGNLDILLETGFCIYDLNRLQDEFQPQQLNGSANREEATIGAFELDFFRAGDLANKDDEEILDVALKAMSAALNCSQPPLDASDLLDSSVFRARNAVSHFCVGSAQLSPPVRLKKGLYACGDWVDRTGHASWSTEKSVVTGRQAAKAFGTDFALPQRQDIDIIPAAQDTEQLRALRQVASAARQVIPSNEPPPSPWAFAARLFGGLR